MMAKTMMKKSPQPFRSTTTLVGGAPAIGAPQLGQLGARSETSRPHSLHLISAKEFPAIKQFTVHWGSIATKR